MKVLLALNVQNTHKDKNGYYEKCLDFIKKHSHEYFIIGVHSYNRGRDLEYTPNKFIQAASNCVTHLQFMTEYDKLKYIASIFDKTDNPVLDFYIIGSDIERGVLDISFLLSSRCENFRVITDLIYSTEEHEDTKEAAVRILQAGFKHNLTTVKEIYE